MKNKFIINNKTVIDIVIKKIPKRKPTKFFILEDNTCIKMKNSSGKIMCSVCNNYFEKKMSSRSDDKIYICKHCMYTGEKNPMYGKPCYYKMTEDEKQRWKNGIKTTLNNKTKEEKDEISKKQRDAQIRLRDADPVAYSKMKAKGGRAATSKSRNYKKTKPEIKLEEFLIQNHVDYDYSCIMGSGEKCYQYDFILRHKRILIEVQGDYWHGHPDMYNNDGSNGKKKLNDTQKNNMKRDIEKRNFAIEKNFKIIYIWESEIKNEDFSKIKEVI